MLSTDVKRAAQDQYVARSAYKLLQIDNKLKLLKKGMTVVRDGMYIQSFLFVGCGKLPTDKLLSPRWIVVLDQEVGLKSPWRE